MCSIYMTLHIAPTPNNGHYLCYDLDASSDGQRESSSAPMNTFINMHVITKYIITQIWQYTLKQ